MGKSRLLNSLTKMSTLCYAYLISLDMLEEVINLCHGLASVHLAPNRVWFKNGFDIMHAIAHHNRAEAHWFFLNY